MDKQPTVFSNSRHGDNDFSGGGKTAASGLFSRFGVGWA
jgi:hypothetical protein